MAFELLGLGPQGTAFRTVATNSKVFLPRCMNAENVDLND